MNKVMKLVSVLVMVVMLTATLSNICFASNIINTIGSDDMGNAVMTDEMKQVGGTIFKTIRNIAAILLVILIAILGIKYMIGSTEEKADYKKSFIPLIVGVALVLAATTIAGFIWNVFDM